MLMNVLLDKFLDIKVSQGSVTMHSRCDGIFNDQFITQSLPSPDDLRNTSICLSVFRSKLKSHLFADYQCIKCIRGFFNDNVLYKFTFTFTKIYIHTFTAYHPTTQHQANNRLTLIVDCWNRRIPSSAFCCCNNRFKEANG